MGYSNSVIRNFIAAETVIARGMIRCGFELETQSTDGMTESSGDEYDEDAISEAISSEVDSLYHEIPRNIRAILSDRVRGRIHEDLTEYVSETFDRSEYCRGGFDTIAQTYNSSLIQVGTDGSVNGFEFRTKGALSYKTFLKAARQIFRADHEIDEGCSFHIHLSLPDVKHYYGQKFQGAIVEYVAANIDRLPDGVKSRLKGVKTSQYFGGLITHGPEKYAFVRFHDGLGTWEFRCFGNVQDEREAKVCLDIAIEAFQYAYRVVDSNKPLLSGESSLSSIDDKTVWARFVQDCFYKSKPLTASRYNSHLNKILKQQRAA